MYKPTTFSVSLSKYFGPHRDMPDKLYLDYRQDKIFSLFKKNIFFKIHPKSRIHKILQK